MCSFGLSGPFWCAQGDLAIAHSACMKSPELISVDKLVAITYITALTDTIDKPSHMANDRVYLFSGTKDTVVNSGVVKKLDEYYNHFVTGGRVITMFIPAEHAMVGIVIAVLLACFFKFTMLF